MTLPLPAWTPHEWNEARVGRVRECADAGMTAREAAIAVDLEPERADLLYKLAKREGFKFKNAGRKRDNNSILVRLDNETLKALIDVSLKLKGERREIAAKVLAAAFEGGGTLALNLLDEGA